MRPYWRVFALAILGMLLAAATEVALPAAAKPFLDGTFIDKDPVLMRWVPVGIILLFIVRGIGTFMGTYASAWVGQRAVMDLRSRMFGKLLTLPQRYYSDNLSGNLISKFSFDVIQVATGVTYVLTILVRDGLTVIGLAGLPAVGELEAHADYLCHHSAHRAGGACASTAGCAA